MHFELFVNRSSFSLSVIKFTSTMAGSKLPEFCLDYRKYTVEMISEPTAAIIKKVRQQMDEVASVPDDQVRWDAPARWTSRLRAR